MKKDAPAAAAAAQRAAAPSAGEGRACCCFGWGWARVLLGTNSNYLLALCNILLLYRMKYQVPGI